jgi:hypothetical protein
LPVFLRSATGIPDRGGMDSSPRPAPALRALLAALALVVLVVLGTGLALLAENSSWAPPFS